MRIKVLILVIIIFFSNYKISGKELISIEKWSHNILIHGNHFASVVDNYGNLISMFFKNGVKIANKEKIDFFTRYGKGPGEISSWKTLCKINEGIAIFEINPARIKIYENINGKYKWTHNVWLKENACYQMVSSAIFSDEKWFVAGEVYEYKFLKKKRDSVNLLRIYRADGEFIKNLINEKVKEEKRFDLISYYLQPYKKHVYFASEEKLILYKIEKQNLNVVKVIKLEIPKFYKKPPIDNYLFKPTPVKTLMRNYEEWKTGYSRITCMSIFKNQLVLQIRTCNPSMSKFALLFYNLSDYKLTKKIFVEDLLLTIAKNKFYFFENGNPSFDENSGDFQIEIYK